MGTQEILNVLRGLWIGRIPLAQWNDLLRAPKSSWSVESPEEWDIVRSEGADAIAQGKNFIDPLLARANSILNTGMVGASGALFGILLGFGMLFPHVELMLLFPPIPLKARVLVLGYGALELISAMQGSPGDNVAHFAHLGGMITGYILLKYWQGQQPNYREW